MPQDKFPLFSAKFGDRLRWLRQRRGLSQAEIADGSASTASSWEKDGKMPRGDRWEGIAERLRLSWPFVAHGMPTDEADYEFLRENRNDVDFIRAPGGVADRLARADRVEEEEQAPYIIPGAVSGGASAELRAAIERQHRAEIAAAGDDIARLGWLLIQHQTHLTPPKEWSGSPGAVIVRTPPHQQAPAQPASGRVGKVAS